MPNKENLQEVEQHELLRALTMTLIQKALDANQEKMAQLDTKEFNLRSSLQELSARIESPEVTNAKIAVTQRKIEEFLATGKLDRVESLRQELHQMAEDMEKLSKEMEKLSRQIEEVEAERKALLTPIFRETFDEIKLGLSSRLSAATTWADRELEEFLKVKEQFGIKLFFNPESQLRIFREGPWREVRDKLDKWLP